VHDAAAAADDDDNEDDDDAGGDVDGDSDKHDSKMFFIFILRLLCGNLFFYTVHACRIQRAVFSKPKYRVSFADGTTKAPFLKSCSYAFQ